MQLEHARPLLPDPAVHSRHRIRFKLVFCGAAPIVLVRQAPLLLTAFKPHVFPRFVDFDIEFAAIVAFDRATSARSF